MSAAPQLLSHWWSRPVAEERAWWADAWEAAAATDELLGTSLVDELRGAAADDGDALLEEYERLLVGPGQVPCNPYESLWREGQPRLEQGRLMATAAGEVVRLYADLGLRVAADAHELPDHVAVEWEALAYAVERGAEEEAERLLRDHLGRWMPAFCAAVATETEHPFYRALAELTPAWTAALAA